MRVKHNYKESKLYYHHAGKVRGRGRAFHSSTGTSSGKEPDKEKARRFESSWMKSGFLLGCHDLSVACSPKGVRKAETSGPAGFPFSEDLVLSS